MDDTSDLSSAEEIALFDKVYQRVSADRPWEGTKTSASGTLSTSVPYVSLASDFGYFARNQDFDSRSEYSLGPAVLVGDNYRPYTIVSWSDRRQYRDQDGYAYLDFANSRIYFTKQPASAESYEYDYHKVPATLGASDEPWFPDRFHDVIVHGMCIESFVIQQSEKAKSYAKEHEALYKSMIADMAYWNAQLVQI